MKPEYSPASPDDVAAIRRLLTENGLPGDDIGPHFGDFFVAKVGGTLVGVAGLEVVGSDALLRSVAVSPGHRGSGIARALCERALGRARERGVTQVFLLTTTAADYFRNRLGFVPLERASAPSAIRATHEFSVACPASATLLTRTPGG